MSLVIKTSPDALQAMRAAKIEEVVADMIGSAGPFESFLENDMAFPSLTNVMRLSQRLAMMREARGFSLGSSWCC